MLQSWVNLTIVEGLILLLFLLIARGGGGNSSSIAILIIFIYFLYSKETKTRFRSASSPRNILRKVKKGPQYHVEERDDVPTHQQPVSPLSYPNPREGDAAS